MNYDVSRAIMNQPCVDASKTTYTNLGYDNTKPYFQSIDWRVSMG
jgi:hypothetical protein